MISTSSSLRGALVTAAPIALFLTAATIALCAPSAALAAAAAAAERGAARVVSYADLDLDKRAGVEALYQRLRAAAADSCGEPMRTGGRIVSAEWRACMAEAVANAVAQVDRPLLTSYHERITATRAPVQAALGSMR